MTSIQTVKLSQILPDPDTNSRHHSAYEEGLKQLADNIQAIGLILPIAVRPTQSGLYRILDGHRRHQALTMIHAGKEEEVDVPVLVREADDADARTLSLAANIMRLPLHPADQYEAFAAMLDEGLSREEIASRFALPLKDVDQRLALGRVAKPFLDAYRNDDLKIETIEDLSALSMSRQFEVLKLIGEQGGLSGNGTDWKVRQLINDKAIFSNNPVVKFVGVEAYEAAGGRVERSLFDDTERLIDTDLLFKLAEEKVPSWIEAMRADGWMFAMREHDMPKNWERWDRHYASPVFSEEDQKRLAETDARLDELNDINPEDWTDELEEEQDKLTEEQHEIRHNAKGMGYTDAEKAESCCVLLKDWRVTYGLVWPKEKAKPEDGAVPAKPEVKGWSQALVDQVESYGTAACQRALMADPIMADTMLLATLYMDAITTSTSKPFAFNSVDRFSDVEINAGADIQRALKSFGIKGLTFESICEAIGKLGIEQRDQLRAVLTARIMKKRRGQELEFMLHQLEATADVIATWKPEKEFFERLTTAQLEEVYRELTGLGFNTPTTKASAVAMVVTKAAEKNWLPKVLRNGQKGKEWTKLAQPKARKEKAPKPVTKVGEDGKTQKRKAA